MSQHLPNDAQRRKEHPLCTGCLDYFPDALLAVAELSRVGNEQHNPGTPLHWDRSKSQDEADALLRHLVDRGTLDTDGVRHSAKVAWRALALLQKEIESDRGDQPPGPRADALDPGGPVVELPGPDESLTVTHVPAVQEYARTVAGPSVRVTGATVSRCLIHGPTGSASLSYWKWPDVRREIRRRLGWCGYKVVEDPS